MPRPTTCSNGEAPVCGCNGVNFWNDCLRRSRGVNLHSNGECSPQDNTCGGSGQIPCPTATPCGYLYSSLPNCPGLSGEGQCWIVPTTCPMVTSGTYRPCDNPSGTCLPKCEAIKTSDPYAVDPTCPR